MGETEYENRCIGYIDILGFREFIKKSNGTDKESRALLPTLIDAVNTVNSDTPNIFSSKKGGDVSLKKTLFSDNIAISANGNADGILAVISALSIISARLLCKGFHVRGAIAQGPLYHSEGDGNVNLIGPALVEAYNLESTIAHNPRIVLSKEVAKFCANYLATLDDKQWLFREIWIKDEDGLIIINPFFFFSKIAALNESDSVRRLAFNNSSAYTYISISELLDHIRDQIEENYGKPDVVRKLKWMVKIGQFVSGDYAEPALTIAEARRSMLNFEDANIEYLYSVIDRRVRDIERKESNRRDRAGRYS